jgi:hypothetical protein
MLTSVENAKKYEKSFGKLKNAFSKTKIKYMINLEIIKGSYTEELFDTIGNAVKANNPDKVFIYYNGNIFLQMDFLKNLDIAMGFITTRLVDAIVENSSLKSTIPIFMILDGNISPKVSVDSDEQFQFYTLPLRSSVWTIHSGIYGTTVQNSGYFAEALADVIIERKFKTFEEMMEKLSQRCNGKNGYFINSDLCMTPVDMDKAFTGLF